MYQDVSDALSQVGQAAYNALPQGIKDSFSASSSQGRIAPRDTPTASAAATTVSSAAAAAAASNIAEGSSIARAKAKETLTSNAPGSLSNNIHTLPSTETEGTLPASGPMGGVGALPGPNTEEGVALLPEERGQYTSFPAIHVIMK